MDSKTYPLTVTVTEKNGFLHILLTTSPLNHAKRHIKCHTIHPFAFLDREEKISSGTAEKIIRSLSIEYVNIPDSTIKIYNDIKELHACKDSELNSGKCLFVVADNPVTRGVVALITDFSLIKKFCGNTEPSWYLARLIRTLDCLSD